MFETIFIFILKVLTAIVYYGFLIGFPLLLIRLIYLALRDLFRRR